MIEIEFKETGEVKKVSCATLLQAFQDDKEKARVEYNGKKFLITGIVEGKYSIGGVSHILLSDGRKPVDNGIICYFFDTIPFHIKSDDIGGLNIGDSVSIKGTIDVYKNLITVINCQLLGLTSIIKKDLVTP